MAEVYFDRVHETSAKVGTGNVSLDGAKTSTNRRFNQVMVDQDTTYVTMVGAGDFMSGEVRYLSSTGELEWVNIVESSNGGLEVSWASGVKDVVMGLIASEWLRFKRGGLPVTSFVGGIHDVTLAHSGRALLVDTTSDNAVFVLPDAATLGNKFGVHIHKRVAANNVAVTTGTPGQFISGKDIVELEAALDSVFVFSDGSNYFAFVTKAPAASASHSFKRHKTTTATGVTGAAQIHTIAFDGVEWDNTGATNNTQYIAQETGEHIFDGAVTLIDITTAMTRAVLELVISSPARTVRLIQLNPVNIVDPAGLVTLPFTDAVQMDEGATASVRVWVANGAGNTASVFGDGTNRLTRFSGRIAR